MANTYVYELDNSLYVNATNKCTNNCIFCVRGYADFIYGDLWLDKEPSVEEVLEAFKNFDLKKYDTVVFCGYGEPTYRMDVIEAVSKFAHKNGLKTRINTNGHANKINNRDVSQIIVDNIDIIGISLNDINAENYKELCKPVYGLEAFDIMIDFAKLCVEKGGNVIFSVVDCIGEEKIEKAKEIAKEVGAKLRVRELI